MLVMQLAGGGAGPFLKGMKMEKLYGHQDHPWLRFHSTAIFTSLEEYEDYLAEII